MAKPGNYNFLIKQGHLKLTEQTEFLNEITALVKDEHSTENYSHPLLESKFKSLFHPATL